MRSSAAPVLLAGIFILILTSCTSLKYAGNYIQRNEARNLALLKDAASYSTTDDSVIYVTDISEERTRQIQEYFKNEGIPKNWLNAKFGTTWDKAMLIAVWVAENVKHSNPTDYPKVRNSIALWEYAKTHPAGFNCRMHAILLGELLTAAGITNRFVTCEAQDSNDTDCHVVNVVWLPELSKWAMIDSDMHEYCIDADGIPLSLQEMRQYLIEDRPFEIVPFEGFSIDTDYLRAYWTKNLYIMSNHGTYGYSLEDDTVAHTDDEPFFYLLPACLAQYSRTDKGLVVTTDAEKFWADPEL